MYTSGRKNSPFPCVPYWLPLDDVNCSQCSSSIPCINKNRNSTVSRERKETFDSYPLLSPQSLLLDCENYHWKALGCKEKYFFHAVNFKGNGKSTFCSASFQQSMKMLSTSLKQIVDKQSWILLGSPSIFGFLYNLAPASHLLFEDTVSLSRKKGGSYRNWTPIFFNSLSSCDLLIFFLWTVQLLLWPWLFLKT